MGKKFRAAFTGLLFALRTQSNMAIHLSAAAGALALAYYLKVRDWEWVALVLTITLVLAAEMFNTALEAAVNLYSPQYHPLARVAKDVAAGAVLVTALGAVIVGMLIFLPKLL
ncbi:MAG: diacylglycerol kinase family protein [Thermoanaerobacteraceae bacterium]|uniref:diacylglycerol kinase family protein n=1 Tax=Thermanaeromonas sp. C210 TaxID=2731925 RepID=UPI00155D1D97|nr:diacylglycerol kinase family protein [Thermanaeromonas sp. C210]MBE3580142.1 diacylglycerol kinase family protein [Thermoanaerobacteraceae bacterium]GFN22510.1 diacylglycerol kinase [Thermanaeromonas sp. C210]